MNKGCNQCELPILNCICNKLPKVCTRAKFWILSSVRELKRPSNTARLLKLANPDSTEIFLWERTKEPDQLIEYINMEKYKTFVLFPTENEDFDKSDMELKMEDKIPAFIILDGTWKEARKIFRKSDFLKDLPNITIKPSCSSKYDLRRGVTQGNLCTIEAAIEIIRMNQEIQTASIIEGYYNIFIKSYKAGISEYLFKDHF